jgi:uncharacterized protein (DUF2384 family)
MDMRAHKNRLMEPRHQVGERAYDQSRKKELEPLQNSHLLQRATEVIGSGAQEWMRTPVPALGNATPVELAQTKQGLAKVLAVLDQLEHGVF